MPVEGAQHEDEALALHRGQIEAARRRPGAFARQVAVKPQRTLQAQPEIAVEREHDSERLAGIGSGQPKTMIALGIGQDDVATIGALPIGGNRFQCGRIDRAGLAEPVRRGSKNDGVRNEFGSPQGGCLGGRKVWVAGESSTPIDE